MSKNGKEILEDLLCLVDEEMFRDMFDVTEFYSRTESAFNIVKALDSADFYYNSTPEDEKKFYDHISELSIRLERKLKKWDRVKQIDEKIRWNKLMVHLGRGFHTFDEYLETQSKLRDERRKVIEEVS